MPKNIKYYFLIGACIFLIIYYKNAKRIIYENEQNFILQSNSVLNAKEFDNDNAVINAPATNERIINQLNVAKGIEIKQSSQDLPVDIDTNWEERWASKLENCELSLGEDDLIGDTAVIERPTSHLVTLASTERPQYSNVSLISLLIDTFGMSAFEFEGSTISEKDIRHQHMYIQYCYETDEKKIYRKCPRIALLPDKMRGDAPKTLPPYLYLAQSKLVKGKRSRGIFTSIKLKTGLIFGPFIGTVMHELHGYYAWRTYYHPSGKTLYIDANNETQSNWMRYVNSGRWLEEQNIFAIESWGNVYYMLIKDVLPGEELLTWYGPGYLRLLGYSMVPFYRTKVYGIAPDRKYVICKRDANCNSIEN